MFTVKQLSTIAGITKRTLRYYDQIDLLKPTLVGENGYRYYGQDALLILQQILLFRAMDMPLDQIRTMIQREGFDALAALHNHRQELHRRINKMERMIATVDNTILFLEGKNTMSDKQLFEAFNDEQQAEYEKEAMQMYDPEIVKASARKWKAYSAEDKKRIADEGNAVYTGFLKAMPLGPASGEAQACVERWRKHMDYFWTPNPTQLVALAEGYQSDPRFKQNFDAIDPGLAGFVHEAVKIYVSRLKK